MLLLLLTAYSLTAVQTGMEGVGSGWDLCDFHVFQHYCKAAGPSYAQVHARLLLLARRRGAAPLSGWDLSNWDLEWLGPLTPNWPLTRSLLW